jgi:serine/threonine protein kinase
MTNINHICCNCLEDTQGHNHCPYCNTPLDYNNPPYRLLVLPPRTILNGSIFVGKCLGAGGFGITYLGLDTTLHRKVVIKEFFPNRKDEDGTALLERNTQDNTSVTITPKYKDFFIKQQHKFLREARTIAALSESLHPNIVRIISYFAENNTAYFIMPYKKGRTLEKYLLEESHITEQQILTIVMQIAEGLDFIHRNNVFHRDIKPSNIYLPDDGEAFLIDFGTARRADTSGILHNPTAYFTAGYSPPEQHKNGEQGAYTDIYAFSATIYTCLQNNGRLKALPPATIYFENGMSYKEQNQKYQQHIIPLIEQVSPIFAKALVKSLHPIPDKRPQGIEEFVNLLNLIVPIINYEIFVVEGEYKGETIELSKSHPLILGRNPEKCNLVFTQNLISRQHCELFIENNKLYLRNFEPSHGTYVNEERLAAHEKRKLSLNEQINLAGCQVLLVVATGKNTVLADDLEPTVALDSNKVIDATINTVADSKSSHKSQKMSWFDKFFGSKY